jgi:hypothetical protein
MHPVLFSLDNIKAGVRNEGHGSCLCSCYVPISKVLDVSAPLQVALPARVYPICLRIVCENLKLTERDGEITIGYFR